MVRTEKLLVDDDHKFLTMVRDVVVKPTVLKEERWKWLTMFMIVNDG